MFSGEREHGFSYIEALDFASGDQLSEQTTRTIDPAAVPPKLSPRIDMRKTGDGGNLPAQITV
jgi:hypothetical protein